MIVERCFIENKLLKQGVEIEYKKGDVQMRIILIAFLFHNIGALNQRVR